jgi:hypothetical protein
LQRTEASFAPLPFDTDAVRAYGRIYVAVTAVGSKARGARGVDLMIAAVACSLELPLYTRNPSDFVALERLVEVIAISATSSHLASLAAPLRHSEGSGATQSQSAPDRSAKALVVEAILSVGDGRRPEDLGRANFERVSV